MGVRPARVLLIESDSDLRQLNELILKEFGYEVETAPPTDDPVETVATRRPAVVVLHLRPNEPRDWQILDRLQGDLRTEAVPVVVIAGAPRVEVEARAAPTVRQAVVMPYDIDALRAAVEEALGHPLPAAVLPPPHHPAPEALAFAGRILAERSREITLRAIRRLQQIEPFASHFAKLSAGLVNQLPVIVGAVVVGLQRNLTPEEVVSPSAIREMIRDHVKLRVDQGLSPASVIREYQVLNDQIQGFLRENIGSAPFGVLDVFDVARTVDSYFAEIIRVAVSDLEPTREQRSNVVRAGAHSAEEASPAFTVPSPRSPLRSPSQIPHSVNEGA